MWRRRHEGTGVPGIRKNFKQKYIFSVKIAYFVEVISLVWKLFSRVIHEVHYCAYKKIKS